MLKVASLKRTSSMEFEARAVELPMFGDTGSGDQSLDGDVRGQVSYRTILREL